MLFRSVTAVYQINVGAAVYGFQTGWGAGLWGGFVSGTTQTTLSASLNSSNTNISVVSTTGFSNATGTVLIDQELAKYSGNTATLFTSVTRGANGTVATTHSLGTTVYNANTFTGWGQSAAFGIPQQLRLWSEANFGD